jgi:carbamoyltransferase
VANGLITRESGFENVWIQPAAGDDGIAIGCAYYGYLEILKQRRSFVMDQACVGRRYTDQDVENATTKFLVRIRTTATRSEDICRETAKLLAEPRVIGWFQGGFRVRTARDRQSQPVGGPAQGRDEGYPE